MCDLAMGQDVWRGLVVTDEVRCSEFERADYQYPQSIELKIAADLGGWWSPYDGTTFENRESDIEHIVAVSESHDSGLCAMPLETRKRFAQDLDNLTLAEKNVNRYQKKHYDAAEWFPEYNRCWFAGRVLVVKLEYGLTVDSREADTLDALLDGCRIENVLRPRQPLQPVTHEDD